MKRWPSQLLALVAGRRRLREVGVDSLCDDFPLHGFLDATISTRFVESLSDEDLETLNQLLPWKSFTADSKGRRFGNRAWEGKREKPEHIPDARIAHMDARFQLSRKHVLEFGCFEGAHTIALCRAAAKVTAVDARIENVVKTIVRTAFFECYPTVFKCDVEQEADWALLPTVDVVHHVGVLYHLKDPVNHLLRLGRIAREGIMLDSHFAHPDEATEHCFVGDQRVSFKRYFEGGRQDVFSGMYDHAKWLTLDSIRYLLNWAGFGQVEVVEERAERNGPRFRLFAAR